MDFHIVAIGASAGGLEAIEDFFENMPNNPGMAFVVIQHLSPNHKSMMVEILSKDTPMDVLSVKDGMVVEPNKIYLIPPGKNIKIFHGKLFLSEKDTSQLPNLPIDIFLRSLGDDQAEKSIAIILSGTGSDGTRGIRSIKERGGMVIVQDVKSAQFDGMPQNALATGLADIVLPPSKMPQHLVSYIDHPYTKHKQPDYSLFSDKDKMDMLFSLIHERHKVDFTNYKLNTVMRRIERRMSVNHIDNLKNYVEYLQRNPHEVTSIYKEFLIGVTKFFRDEKAFNELYEKWIPSILSKQKNKDVRIWVPGCSTGEEAYSIAILLQEIMEKTNNFAKVKLFATDLDQESIKHAARGIYTESIVADVSSERLKKYFVSKEEGFQISREIREMIVFSQHNILEDPPFNNIDLISCRNLLIYMQPVLQKRILELFNYSLKDEGILFLGPSETTGDLSDYFKPLDNKWKIYSSRGRLKNIDMHRLGNVNLRPEKFRPHKMNNDSKNTLPLAEDRLVKRILETLQKEYIPLTIVVNEENHIQYTLGNTEGYFKLPAGMAVYDVTKMIHPKLSIPISTSLQKAFKDNEEVQYSKITLNINNEIKNIKLKVKPIPSKQNQEPLAAIFIESIDKVESSNNEYDIEYDIEKEAEQRIQDLEQQLQLTKESLQATIEELETSNEELQATNEELLASNEELQSTNEELHSVNEELHTVNAEHQSKIIELTELNNDMENLLSNTKVGTLFLDENLDIRKYTSPINEIVNIDASDIGKQFQTISSQLVDTNLKDTVNIVQQTSQPKEIEVQNNQGKWFVMKILPYEVAPETYSGILITNIDITQLKSTQHSLEKSNAWLKSAASLAKIGGWEIDVDTMKTYWTDEVYKIYEVDRKFDHNVENDVTFYHPDDREKINSAVKEAIEKGTPFDLILRFTSAKSNNKWVRAIGDAEINEDQSIKRVYGAFQDITDEILTKNKLNAIKSMYRQLYDKVSSAVLIIRKTEQDSFLIKDINTAGKNLFSKNSQSLKGKDLFEYIPQFESEDLKNKLVTINKTGKPVHISISNCNESAFEGCYEIFGYLCLLTNEDIIVIINNYATEYEGKINQM